MNKNMMIFLFILSFSNIALAANYDDCVLVNMKGVGSDIAAKEIQRACKQQELSGYENCILENMKGVGSDTAAVEIQKACRAKFPSSWEVAPSATFCSTPTYDNGNRRSGSHHCEHRSPEGKYCANAVTINGRVPNNEEYTYRFKTLAKNPIYIASGPQGWMQVLNFGLSSDKKRFSASIKGWTSPQVFCAKLDVERRKR